MQLETEPVQKRCRLILPLLLSLIVHVLLLVCCAAFPMQAGCINVMTIAGKVLFGDPVVMSSFQQQTGVSLAEGHTVGIVCTAPASLTGTRPSIR